MASSKFGQILESGRWAPYKLGGLAALPVIGVMLLAWIYCDTVAIVWFFLYPLWAGLGIFWKTPMRKMVSTALLLGTVVPMLIMFAR